MNFNSSFEQTIPTNALLQFFKLSLGDVSVYPFKRDSVTSGCQYPRITISLFGQKPVRQIRNRHANNKKMDADHNQ